MRVKYLKLICLVCYSTYKYNNIHISRSSFLSRALATCTTMTSPRGAHDTQVCTLYKKNPFSSNNLAGKIYDISDLFVVRRRSVLLFHSFFWKTKSISIQIYKHKSILSRWLWNRSNSRMVFDKVGQVNGNTLFWVSSVHQRWLIRTLSCK